MTGMELKVKRIRSGRRQYEVAAALGICPTVLCDLENGRRTLQPELLSRILHYLEARDGTERVRSNELDPEDAG